VIPQIIIIYTIVTFLNSVMNIKTEVDAFQEEKMTQKMEDASG
jgi:hypothetical protein